MMGSIEEVQHDDMQHDGVQHDEVMIGTCMPIRRAER